MAASGAKSGFGTTLTVGGTAVTEIVEIGPPGLERNMIDVTNMGSDNAAREFIGGLLNGGEVSVKLQFKASVATTLVGYFTESAAKAHILTLPSSLGVFTYNAWIMSYKPQAVIDDKVTADVTFKVTGAVTYT